MAKYVSGRQKNLKVGISSYSENLTSLEIVGNVGINTTNATAPLDVLGGAIFRGSSPNELVRITQIGTGPAFIVEDSENPDVTPFLVTTEGKVAIGVAAGGISTSYKLEVDGGDIRFVSGGKGDLIISHQDLVSNVRTAGNIQLGLGANGGDAIRINLNNNVGLGTTNPTSKLYVFGDGYFTGVVTATAFNGNAVTATYATSAGIATYAGTSGIATYATSSGIATYATSAGIATNATYATTAGVSTFSGYSNVSGVSTSSGYASNAGIATYATNSGISTYSTTAGVATALQNSRTFEITGDVVASPVTFNGTGNVSLAATIQPNSVALGTDTTGDYVQSISGTSNQITVTSGTGESSIPTLSIPTQFTAPQDVTVTRDLQVNRNLNVTGNITIGGTSATIFSQSLNIYDPDIVLGYRTDGSGNDISNDNTANHGGIAIASTEGTPLVKLFVAGIETNPATYKKIMWFKAGEFAGLGTDAWLVNYAVGIGSTQFPTGTRLAAGAVQFTERDLAVVRNINASGIVTASSFSGNASSATYATNSGVATYATSAGIATYATSSGIATYATTAGIATYATNAGISTYATTAEIATNATYATSAGIATYATNSGIATYATSAGIATYATNSGIATYATSAGIATYAANSGVSTYATSAGIATYASTAGIATYAGASGIATYASTAGIATYAGASGIATYASTAGIATYATSAGIATYAGASGIATYATNAGVSTYATSAGIATYAGASGIATYASTAGIATYAGASGIATYAGTSGIATYATNAGVSTYATSAGIATYAGASGIATYATNAGVSTYATNSGIATYATSAGIATYATNAGIATYATNAGIATYATSAGIATYATNAGIATYATSAGISTYATNSGIATYATSAGIATYATSAGIATYATNSGIATYATNSGIATYATSAGIATYATNSGIATYATSAGIATYATNSGIATYATSAGIATYASTAGIATYSTSSGIATYATSAGLSTHLKGGSGGTLVYQSATDTTAFLSNGLSGQILQSNGGTSAPSWVNSAPSNAITGLTIRDEGTIVGGANSVSQINFVGNIVTATSSSGIATITFLDYVSNSGIATNVIGGIASVTQLNVTGITTLGITSATNFTSQQINITGITTLSNLRIIPVGTGATVGSVGILTYYGDGSKLSGISAGVGVNDDTTTNSTYYVGISTIITGTLSSLVVSSTKLTFNPSTGNLVAGGTVTANSDRKLKTNIKTIDNALHKVLSLRGVEFDRIDTGDHQIGVIAQEVEEIIPDVVYGEETKSVAYANLVGLLIEAIKEQNKQIQELKRMLEGN